MCGIAGEVSFGEYDPSPEHIRRMCDLMTHRGPDEEGYYVSKRAVLGLRRLKVIGIINGSQPVYNHSETAACVFNGEIYNYLELKTYLEREGYIFKTNTDAEAIIHLYDKVGDSFVQCLRGMFAIAIYDEAQGRLILARDITGKKPLNYYVTDRHSVVFASEIASLISHPASKKQVNFEAIDRFLSFRIIPAPLSIYHNVFKVEPGTLLSFDKEGKSEKRYWEFDFSERVQGQSRGEMEDNITRLLYGAVSDRLYSEMPVGALLSGGLDSSLVVAMMSRLRKDPVHTFSVGFKDREFNELNQARLVSDHCQTIHHEYIISPDSVVEVIDELLLRFGEPFAFPSAIACYFMNRLARKSVTVVLTGDGADEIFCGYNRYKIMAGFPELPVRQRDLAKVDLDLLEGARGDIAIEYQSVLTDGLRDSLKRKLYSEDLIRKIPGKFPVNYLRERFLQNSSLKNRLSRVMHVDCGFWLRDAQLVKIDITSMANSIEVRCPMLDQELVEYVTGINVRHKLVNGNEKCILKAVARRFLPEQTVNREKQEIAVPLENWLTTSLRREIESVLLSDESLSRGYFEPDNLIQFVRNYNASESYAVWTLYILEKWHLLFAIDA